jgi:hypothetical protein
MCSISVGVVAVAGGFALQSAWTHASAPARDGRKLEAHSGLGSYMDNARYVHIKHIGPTPPNTYRLALRESLFHGVQAIRLIPVGDGNMFGRDGILAHHYLLGPNGQSNGCVSFADYSQFLNAYLNGEIDRLVWPSVLRARPVP